MKIVRKVETIITETVDHFCNKCGLSCKSPQGAFYGLIDAEVCGGFESTHLEDGAVHRFSLCERCIAEISETFKYDSFQGNFLFPEEDHVDGFDPDNYWGDATRPTSEEFIELAPRTQETLNYFKNSNEEYDDDDEVVEILNPLNPLKKEDLN